MSFHCIICDVFISIQLWNGNGEVWNLSIYWTERFAKINYMFCNIHVIFNRLLVHDIGSVTHQIQINLFKKKRLTTLINFTTIVRVLFLPNSLSRQLRIEIKARFILDAYNRDASVPKQFTWGVQMLIAESIPFVAYFQSVYAAFIQSTTTSCLNPKSKFPKLFALIFS